MAMDMLACIVSAQHNSSGASFKCFQQDLSIRSRGSHAHELSWLVLQQSRCLPQQQPAEAPCDITSPGIMRSSVVVQLALGFQAGLEYSTASFTLGIKAS